MGIENFAEMRTRGYYYADKTGFIRELIKNIGKVNLFTRPGRFGKTLNISMLKYFLRQAVTVRFLTDFKFPGKRNYVRNIWENILLFRLAFKE